MLNNRNRITFNSILGPKTFDHDPIGYNKLETTLARSKKSHGIFTSITQNLEFTFEARFYLLNLFLLEGVNARCTMVRQKRDPYTDIWTTIDEGSLDLSFFKYTKTTATTDYLENSFSEKFDNYMKEDFEIDRLDDIDGNPLVPINYRKMVTGGVNLFLRSRFFMSDGDKMNFDNSNRNNFESEAVELKIEFNSDPENLVQPYQSAMDEGNQSIGNGRAGNMFYLRADRPHSIILNGTLSGTMIPARSADSFAIDLVKYGYSENGSYPLLSKERLYTKTNFTNRKFTFSFNQKNIDLKTDESLALVVSVVAGGRSSILWDDCGFEVTEDSSFKTTACMAVTAREVGSRLVKIMDSKAEFESDVFEEDGFRFLLMTSGESIRNVKRKDDNGVDTEIPVLTTSFEDFYNAINTILPVAYDVIFRDGKNIVTLNKIDHFFRDNTVVKLGRVSNIENEVNPEWVYSSIKIGYSNSGDVDGVNGLQATHTVNTYTLPIDRVENTYEATTEYRCDVNEIETQRRIQYADFPERDSKYDKDVFMLDADAQASVFVPRANERDFDSVSGVYSADTTYNNRLSPANCVLRHAPIFKSGMDRDFYGKQMLRYASTNGNPNLVTSIDGIITPEKLNRRIDQMQPALFSEMKVIFESNLEDSIYEAVRKINNRYRTIDYINEDGQSEQGYIYKMEFGDSIKYELRKISNG